MEWIGPEKKLNKDYHFKLVLFREKMLNQLKESSPLDVSNLFLEFSFSCTGSKYIINLELYSPHCIVLDNEVTSFLTQCQFDLAF